MKRRLCWCMFFDFMNPHVWKKAYCPPIPMEKRMTRLAVQWHSTTKRHWVGLRHSAKSIPPIYECSDCNWKRRP